MRRRSRCLALGLAAAAASCSTTAEPSSVVRDLIAADDRGDLAAVLASYTDDVVWLPAAGPRVEGKAAIEQRYVEMFRAFEVDLDVRIDAERFEGGEAVVSGTTSGELRPRDGGAVQIVDDEFTARLRREGERWRICRLAWQPRAPGQAGK